MQSAGFDARVVHCNGRGRPDRLRVDGRLRAAAEAVGQDVRDVGDVVEKFTGDPPVRTTRI